MLPKTEGHPVLSQSSREWLWSSGCMCVCGCGAEASRACGYDGADRECVCARVCACVPVCMCDNKNSGWSSEDLTLNLSSALH